ncbi:MAG TPA: M1 family metallopeptidase, partial [Ilumatobacteraceae bacterium]|nr:M1 family metallopeptidase [Ilumatobacteraceae bacterium]
RRTGGLVSLAVLSLTAACTTDPGVVATGAQTGTITTQTTAATPTTDSVPASEPSLGTQPDVGSTTTSAPPAATDPNGIGDTLFPALGNPGIDVQHYVVALQYDPARKRISATVHLDIDMTQDRQTFSLDSAGPVVSAVRVDGAPATFDAAVPELIITPPSPLTNGQHIAVDIDYTIDNPQPTLSQASGSVGWFTTPGGSYVLDEPEGARTWLPSDDHPSDKASFRFELTVPTGVTAVANGAMLDHTSAASTDTWIWQEDRPMATYMIQLLTGDYQIINSTGPNNLPLTSVVLHNDATTMQPYVDAIGDEIDYLDDFFGPYPLDRYGIAITDSMPGLAMETFERSLFSRGDFATGRLESSQQLLLSHELTHQWFGDAVTPAVWEDIWLAESFATYGEWMWLEHVGQQTVEQSAQAGLDARQVGATASPAANSMFGFNSYDGGAVVLHALRKTIGNDKFFALLQQWAATNNGQSRTTADFVALAGQVAGQDLTEFFNTWLFADVVPTTFPT